jgi:hypothetical protein
VRILVVEAVICEQERITKNLSEAGYEVMPCCDGDWAFVYLRTHPCDVVVVGRFNGSRIKEAQDLVEAIHSIDPGQSIVILQKPYGTKRLIKWVAAARRELLPLFDGY